MSAFKNLNKVMAGYIESGDPAEMKSFYKKYRAKYGESMMRSSMIILVGPQNFDELFKPVIEEC